MPIYWVPVADGTWCITGTQPFITTSATTSSNVINIWISNNATATTTSGGTYMAMSVFDTPRYFMGAQAAQAQAALQQQVAQQLLNARPGGLINTTYQQLGQLQAPPPPTPEQIAARDRRLREDAERAQQAVRNRESATRRARDLLLDHLTPAQRDTFMRHGWFVVEGGRSKTQYRIHTDRGPAGNIHELDAAGNAVAQLCGHIRHMQLPLCDELLAQMIMLRADEDGYRALANRSRLR